MGFAVDHKAIEIVSDVHGDDGVRKPCARLTCHACGVVARRWITGRLAPELLAKHFEGLGWTLHADTAECGACRQARIAARRTNKDLRLMKATDTPPIVVPLQPRPLTPAERTQARLKLDACFDDQSGFYLNGESDQSVAASLNLPWASLRDYREVAFGPLKGNSETAALKDELVGLAGLITAAETRLAKEIAPLREAHAALTQKLAALEKKLGF